MLNKNIIGANILANGQDFLIFNVGIVYYNTYLFLHACSFPFQFTFLMTF